MPNDAESPLEQAQRHIALGESLIAEQRAIIARLRSDGHSTRDAERLLVTLEQTLTLMHLHLAHEQFVSTASGSDAA